LHLSQSFIGAKLLKWAESGGWQKMNH